MGRRALLLLLVMGGVSAQAQYESDAYRVATPEPSLYASGEMEYLPVIHRTQPNNTASSWGPQRPVSAAKQEIITPITDVRVQQVDASKYATVFVDPILNNTIQSAAPAAQWGKSVAGAPQLMQETRKPEAIAQACKNSYLAVDAKPACRKEQRAELDKQLAQSSAAADGTEQKAISARFDANWRSSLDLNRTGALASRSGMRSYQGFTDDGEQRKAMRRSSEDRAGCASGATLQVNGARNWAASPCALPSPANAWARLTPGGIGSAQNKASGGAAYGLATKKGTSAMTKLYSFSGK